MHAVKTAVIIGAGMVAKTHILAGRDAYRKVALKGIVSRGSERALRLLREVETLLPSPLHIYPSVEAVAADPEVDFAIIVTPPNARIELVRILAKAGKHILLEKPIARNTDEARQIIEICKSYHVRMGVTFQHRMRIASIKARELVASGRLGALGVCELSVPWWREQAYYDEPGRGTIARDGGGVLISQAIHTLDLALSLTGPVRSVQALAATSRFHRMESEDFVCAGLRFANGAVGSLVASTASYPGRPESITLHFEQASLSLVSGNLQVDWRDGRSESFGEAATGTGSGANPMAFTHEWHQRIIEDFADALNEDRLPIADGDTALQTHSLIDAILESARSGKEMEIPHD